MDNLHKANERFINKAWPLYDVLNKFIETADILLKRKNYDGHGYELIVGAQKSAKEMVAELKANAGGEDARGASELMRMVSDNRRWKSVDKEPPPVNEQLLFWHDFHKCSVAGWINENEVIEKTRTTKWPLEAFTHWTKPLKTPE